MGNAQWNGKECKSFRDALALGHIADFKKADADISKNKYVNARLQMIETDKERLTKIEAGDATLGNKADIEAEIKRLTLEVEVERERVKEYKRQLDNGSQKAMDTLTDEVKQALDAYADGCSFANERALNDAYVKWFTEKGVKNVPEDYGYQFIRPIGMKQASNRTKCQKSVHTVALKGQALYKMALAIIYDDEEVKKVLPIYKWENVIEEKTRKQK